MLKEFLKNNTAQRLIRDIRGRHKPTLFCFYGGDPILKAVIANHLCRIQKDLVQVDKIPSGKRKPDYIILQCEKDIDLYWNEAEKNGYNCVVYIFSGD